MTLTSKRATQLMLRDIIDAAGFVGAADRSTRRRRYEKLQLASIRKEVEVCSPRKIRRQLTREF